MARRRKSTITRRDFIARRRRTRIRIPQPPERPLQLLVRDALKTEVISEDPDWFIKHVRGPRRQRVGADPLEARAVPHDQVRGFLPERIIYKWLTDIMHWREGAEFSFQSALDGGRVELGGIVADFIIHHLRIILNPVGPTHSEYLRSKKDEEQKQDLAEMGYTQFEIPEEKVYDEVYFDAWMRRVLGLTPGLGSGGEVSNGIEVYDPHAEVFWRQVLNEINGAYAALEGV